MAGPIKEIGSVPLSIKNVAAILTVIILLSGAFAGVHRVVVVPSLYEFMREVSRAEIKAHESRGPHKGVSEALEEIRLRLTQIETKVDFLGKDKR